MNLVEVTELEIQKLERENAAIKAAHVQALEMLRDERLKANDQARLIQTLGRIMLTLVRNVAFLNAKVQKIDPAKNRLKQMCMSKQVLVDDGEWVHIDTESNPELIILTVNRASIVQSARGQ